MKGWLDRLAHEVILEGAARYRFRETGGPLFGFEEEQAGGAVVVAAAFGPGHAARHRRRSFEPDFAATQRAIRAVHEASGGRYRFIGTWHTHPRGAARPSGIDLATARSIASDASVDLLNPVLLIVATTPTLTSARPTNLAAFRLSDAHGRLEPIELATAELPARLVGSSLGPWPESSDVVGPTSVPP